MKLRRVALINYLIFLGIMGVVWFLTVRKDHISQFHNHDEFSKLIQELQENIQLRVHFQIQDSFSEDYKSNLNLTINKQFQKVKCNLTIDYDIQTFDQKAATVLIEIKKSEQNSYSSKSLQHFVVNLNPETTGINGISNIIREFKRIILVSIPNMETEETLDSQQIYAEKLYIFDFYIIKLTDNDYKIQDIMHQYLSAINMWFDKLSLKNFRINYEVISEDYINNHQLSKIDWDYFQNIMPEYTNEQQHRANYKEYLVSNNILVINNHTQISTLNQNEEPTDFFYKEPNTLLYNLRINQNIQEQIFEQVFQLITRKLLLQDQFDLFDSINYFNYVTNVNFLIECFAKRDQLRIYKKWIKEIQYLQYLGDEPDYKITKENYITCENHVKNIQTQLLNFNYSKYASQDEYYDAIVDNKVGQLDTFSFEYLLGVYIPIILPFVYPIVMGTVDEYRESKKRRQTKVKVD